MDKDLLATYDIGILQLGKNIFDRRKAFVESFLPIFQKHYQNLSDNQEYTNLIYLSDFEADDFEAVFKQNLQKDLLLQRTTLGIHKDDFVFKINENTLKRFGSQGQQKSFLIALKLAQFQIVAQEKNDKPLLLLDDIFDKLDEKRINQLIQMVAANIFGQIFITDARPERSKRILDAIDSETKFITISNGKVINRES